MTPPRCDCPGTARFATVRAPIRHRASADSPPGERRFAAGRAPICHRASADSPPCERRFATGRASIRRRTSADSPPGERRFATGRAPIRHQGERRFATGRAPIRHRTSVDSPPGAGKRPGRSDRAMTGSASSGDSLQTHILRFSRQNLHLPSLPPSSTTVKSPPGPSRHPFNPFACTLPARPHGERPAMVPAVH